MASWQLLGSSGALNASAAFAAKAQLAVAGRPNSLDSNGWDDGASSNRSSAEALAGVEALRLGLDAPGGAASGESRSSGSLPMLSSSTPRRRNSNSSSINTVPSPRTSSASPAGDEPGSTAAQARHASGSGQRRGSGYRRLWASIMSRSGNKGDERVVAVTVEDLVKQIAALPPASSAVEAIRPALPFLDSRAVAALLKSLGKAGLAPRAVELFDWLRGLERDHELASLVDIYTYTTCIAQCNSHQGLRRALELVAEMRARGVPLNVHTYSALLNVCLKAGELDLSLDVHNQMLAEECVPNLVTYHTLLDIYQKKGAADAALGVLDLLAAQAIKPEVRTYNTVMATCNAAGRHADAIAVHAAMRGAGVEPNGATFNQTLTAYARSGQLEAAMNVYNAMAGRGYERGCSAHTALLAACEGAARWDVALQLLSQMASEGARPNTACLNSAMLACLHGGQPARAEALFERLYAVAKPDGVTFNALARAYCALGKAREAANILDVMQRGGQAVEGATYDATIEAAWASGVVPLQGFAVQLFDRTRCQGGYPVLVSQQAAAEGTELDIQLPAGSPHVLLLCLLHTLGQLRELLAGAAPGCLAKVTLRVPLQGAADAGALGNVLSSQLRTLASPFAALPALNSLQYAADGAALADWLRGSALAVALGALAPRPCLVPGAAAAGGQRLSLDGVAVAQEDAQRELRCRQALLSVQGFEASCHIDAQAIPQAVLLQRPELVQLLLRSAPCLGLAPELGHDACQLFDRACSAGLASGMLPARLLAGACLAIVAGAQDGGGITPMLAALYQVPVPQLLAAARQVRGLLGSSCVAISALRVLRLLLERLGVEPDDAASARYVCGQGLAVMCRAAMSPAFLGCSPSTAAACVLYACRVAAGLLPAWPAAVQGLTGLAPDSSPELLPLVQAAMALVLEL